MRLLIADDHGIVRGGLKLLLDRQPDMEVIAEACDGVEAVELALREKPDICVLDVSMPRMTGLQATVEIKTYAPEIAVLVLSMYDDERYLFEALQAGHPRHRHVEHADVGLLAQRHLDGLDAVAGLRDDLHVGLAVEQQLQAAAHDAVVVCDQEPHAAATCTRVPRARTVSSTVVPSPGADVISRRPPASSARSRIPARPERPSRRRLG